uniref:Uncharacterized protein n=1 Tax=Nelumbo nucifera TaxID=4432 RepID=A0A822YAH0_NELNU|nr:TPA_asm: hypothetical protein HUJ06_030875 [Nelumbo nucifera]
MREIEEEVTDWFSFDNPIVAVVAAVSQENRWKKENSKKITKNRERGISGGEMSCSGGMNCIGRRRTWEEACRHSLSVENLKTNGAWVLADWKERGGRMRGRETKEVTEGRK